MIQCARLAFGFVGIYDEDEAQRIRETDMGKVQVVEKDLPMLSQDRLEELFANVESCTSLEELKEVWKIGNAEMLAAKHDNKFFKQLVADKGASLKLTESETA